MKHLRHFIPLFLVTLSGVSAAQPSTEDGGDAISHDVADLRQSIAYCETTLAKYSRLLATGAASAGQVDGVRAVLCMQKHDLAVTEGDFSEIDRQRRMLLEIRERECQRWRKVYQRGHASELQMNDALRRQAVNRYIVAEMDGQHNVALRELRRTVELCQTAVESREKALGQQRSALAKINWFRSRLACAKYQLAIKATHSDKTVAEFRELVDELRRDWERMEQQYERGATTFIEVYFAQTYFVTARLRLARLEGKTEIVKELLGQLVELHENTLRQSHQAEVATNYTLRAGQSIRLAISRQLERDQRRHSKFLRAGELIDDPTLGELDP